MTIKLPRLPYREDAAFSLLAFAVFLLPLAFSLYSYENFESVKFSLFLLCVGSSAFVFFLKSRQVGRQWRLNKFFYLLLAFFGFWALLSAVFAKDHIYSIFGAYYRYTSGLVFVTAFLLFIFLLINLLNQDRLNFLLKVLVCDALVVSVISFLQAFGWIFYGGLDINGFYRGPSLLGNTNYSAMFLAAVLPLAVYFFARAGSFKSKVYYATAVFLMLLGSLMLASRGALLSMVMCGIAALVLIGAFRFPKKFFFSLLISFVLAAAFGWLFINTSRPAAVSSIVSQVDSNTIDRFYAWDASLRGIRQSPLLGSGLGNYALFFERSMLDLRYPGVGVFDDAHNLFLLLAVTGGLPLLFLFLCLILFPAFLGLKHAREKKDPLALVLVLSLLAWLVGASFNPVPVPMYMMLAVILSGLVSVYAKFTNTRPKQWPKIALGIFGLVLFVFGASSLVSEHLLGFGIRAYGDGNFGLAYRLTTVGFALNPTSENLLEYKIGSAIYLRIDQPQISLDINRLKSLHPQEPAIYVSVSNLYALANFLSPNQADLQQAIASMETALKLDPQFAARYGQLSLYYYQLGDLQKAKTSVQKDLALDNTDFSGWVLLARLYQASGQKAQTVWALTKAFGLRPDLPQLKYILELAKNTSDIKSVPLQISVRAPSLLN